MLIWRPKPGDQLVICQSVRITVRRVAGPRGGVELVVEVPDERFDHACGVCEDGGQSKRRKNSAALTQCDG